MKYFIFTLCIIAISFSSQAQLSNKIEKLQTVFKTASTVKDLKDLIDGDVASAICSLLGAGTVCNLLSVTPLNTSEKEELDDIKSKWALEQFLIEKGIEPDDFYKKLNQQKNSETIQSRLDFLKNKN